MAGRFSDEDREVAAILFGIGEEKVMRAVRLLNGEAHDGGWIPHEHGANCGRELDGQFYECMTSFVRDTRWRDPKAVV